MSEPRYVNINCPEMVHLISNLEPRWKPMAEFDGNDFNELNSIAEALDKIPTIDIIKHAKWIDSPDSRAFYCSACEFTTDYHLSKYCPDCGAAMDL